MARKNKKQNKLETYAVSKKLYRFLRHHSDLISFEKLPRNVYGYYEMETHEIIIDYRRDIISTLIHEFLHHIYPEWCETKVIKMESRLINSMSPKQIKNIIKILGTSLSDS